MRQLAIFSLVSWVASLALGCGMNSSPTTPPDSKVNEAKEKISDAAEATAEAARAKRDEYAHEMQKKLDELDVKYKALERRAAEARGDARKDLDEKVEAARARRDAAARKLDELKEAGLDRWEKVKDGVGNAFDDLKKIVE